MIADPERFSSAEAYPHPLSAPLVPELNFHLARRDHRTIWPEHGRGARLRQGLLPALLGVRVGGVEQGTGALCDGQSGHRGGGRHVLDFACGAAPWPGLARRQSRCKPAWKPAKLTPLAVIAARANALRSMAWKCMAEEADLIGTPPLTRGWDVVLAGDVFYEGPGAQRTLPAGWTPTRARLHPPPPVLDRRSGRTFLPQRPAGSAGAL